MAKPSVSEYLYLASIVDEMDPTDVVCDAFPYIEDTMEPIGNFSQLIFGQYERACNLAGIDPEAIGGLKQAFEQGLLWGLCLEFDKNAKLQRRK